MSSSTALLPKDRKKDDHPIFLRVCHSPWNYINQNKLVALRGLIAAYLLASFISIIHYDLKYLHRGRLVLFEFSNIVYFLQLVYAVIAFTWTYMHLNYPHHASQNQSPSTRTQKFFSPPRQHPSTNNRTFFSIFYTAAVTFPLVVTFIYWAVLIPKHEAAIPGDQIFGQGWYRVFFVFAKHGVNTFIALLEVFFLSSIRRQTPIGAHIAGLSFLTLLYVAWANVGYILIDKYSLFFLDHKKIGWNKVGGSIVGFVALTDLWFCFIYGLTGAREKATKKSDRSGNGQNSGYQRLPQ